MSWGPCRLPLLFDSPGCTGLPPPLKRFERRQAGFRDAKSMKKIRSRVSRFLMRSYALELSVLLGAVVLLTQLGMVYSHTDQRAETTMPVAGIEEAGMPVIPALDPEDVAEWLVEAVIQVESGGRAEMVGRAGERGIMQIKRSTWTQVTRRLNGRAIPFDRAFDPELNRRVGKAYLAEIQRILHSNRSSWKSDERSLLLACYNAGPERVRRAGYDIKKLPRSVQCYVQRASALHDYYLAEDAPRVRELLLTALIQASPSDDRG